MKYSQGFEHRKSNRDVWHSHSAVVPQKGWSVWFEKHCDSCRKVWNRRRTKGDVTIGTGEGKVQTDRERTCVSRKVNRTHTKSGRWATKGEKKGDANRFEEYDDNDETQQGKRHKIQQKRGKTVQDNRRKGTRVKKQRRAPGTDRHRRRRRVNFCSNFDCSVRKEKASLTLPF